MDVSALAVTPTSEGSTRLSIPLTRRFTTSPSVSSASSFDTRRNSTISTDTRDDYSTLPDSTYYDRSDYRSTFDPDNSMNEEAEVEAALTAIDDGISRSDDVRSDTWASTSYGTHSMSAVTAATPYSMSTVGLGDRSRVLSSIGDRTESSRGSESGYDSVSSLGLGSRSGPGLLSSIIRPSALFSSSAEAIRRSLYGPVSPTASSYTRSPTDLGTGLATSVVSSAVTRSATPDRAFRPAPPSGRRAGDLIAFFEDKTAEAGHPRASSVPLGPRAQSPYRPTSPAKSSTQASTMSSLFSPAASYTTASAGRAPPSTTTGFTSSTIPSSATSSATATVTATGTEYRRPRSPLGLGLAGPRTFTTLTGTTSRTGSGSGSATITAGSGTGSSTITGAVPAGEGLLGLRRRDGTVRRGVEGVRSAAVGATGGASISVGGGQDPSPPPPYGSEGGNGDGGSGSGGSSGGAPSSFDLSELGSFARGSQTVSFHRVLRSSISD